MPLTEQKIRSFRPEPGKKQRLFDARGLSRWPSSGVNPYPQMGI
jgi:hypothetical protein